MAILWRQRHTYLVVLGGEGGVSGGRIRVHAINNETKYILQF